MSSEDQADGSSRNNKSSLLLVDLIREGDWPSIVSYVKGDAKNITNKDWLKILEAIKLLRHDANKEDANKEVVKQQ